jgi:PAS domain S-box-containing protein
MELLMSVKSLSLILLIGGIGLAFSQIRLSGWVLGWILLSGALLLQGFRSMLGYVAENGGVDASGYALANDWMGLGFSLLIVASMHMMREVFTRHRLAAESLRMISAAANEANIALDDKGIIVVWNQAAQKIFGYSVEEAQGRKLDELIVPERCRDEFKNASIQSGGDGREPGSTPVEVAGLRKDGTEIVTEYSLSTLDIDGKRHAIYIFRDITARKQAEERIRERTSALEMLSARMLTSDEMEKKKLAYGLHEGLAQTLVAIKLRVERSLKALAPADARDDTPESIVSLLQGAISDVEAIATALRPSSLDEIGLLRTIGGFCREFDRVHPAIQVRQQLSVREEDVPESLKIVIYRIIQSAFTNIVRYESTDQIALELQRKDGAVTVAIEDISQDSRYMAVAGRDTELQLRFGEEQERTTLSGGSFRIARGKTGGVALYASWAV